MYNVILDELPETIAINGREYPIITDFKNWLEFVRLLDQPLDQIDEITVIEAFAVVFDEMPDEPADDIINALMSFMKAEKAQERKPDEPVLMRDIMKEDKPEEPAVVDYDFDAHYIYAGFLQQYALDLRVESFHWYIFRALFAGLVKPCKIVEIMGYRSIKDFGKMSKSEKSHYREMQKIHALPDKRSQEEKDSEFANGL